MNMAQYQSSKQALFTLFNQCAPNGKAQAAFVKVVENIERDYPEADNPPFQDMIRQMVGRLYDGLAYGNWPE